MHASRSPRLRRPSDVWFLCTFPRGRGLVMMLPPSIDRLLDKRGQVEVVKDGQGVVDQACSVRGAYKPSVSVSTGMPSQQM